MSFAVRKDDFEWSGQNARTLFCQTKNLFNPKMWRMVWDILQFNQLATTIAFDCDEFLSQGKDMNQHPLYNKTIHQFIKEHNFGSYFFEYYLVPMTSAIWSSPGVTILEFPILTLLMFMRNHCLLQLGNRPVWKTVLNGSRQYIKPALEGVEVKMEQVLSVERPDDTNVSLID
jgi:predicted NAD/FAD-binding protein